MVPRNAGRSSEIGEVRQIDGQLPSPTLDARAWMAPPPVVVMIAFLPNQPHLGINVSECVQPHILSVFPRFMCPLHDAGGRISCFPGTQGARSTPASNLTFPIFRISPAGSSSWMTVARGCHQGSRFRRSVWRPAREGPWAARRRAVMSQLAVHLLLLLPTQETLMEPSRVEPAHPQSPRSSRTRASGDEGPGVMRSGWVQAYDRVRGLLIVGGTSWPDPCALLVDIFGIRIQISGLAEPAAGRVDE